MATYYDKKGLVNIAHSGFISLAMFLVFCLCGQLTGGHANPIITLSLMFTRGTKIGLIEGVVYIVSQFAGSIAGGAVGIVHFIQLTEWWTNLIAPDPDSINRQ